MASFFNKLFGNNNQKNQELSEALKNGAILVDVRTPQEFAAGSAPGAINIPVAQISTQTKLLRQNKAGVIVFCRSGMRAAQAKNMLNANGLNAVWNAKTVSKATKL